MMKSSQRYEADFYQNITSNRKKIISINVDVNNIANPLTAPNARFNV